MSSFKLTGKNVCSRKHFCRTSGVIASLLTRDSTEMQMEKNFTYSAHHFVFDRHQCLISRVISPFFTAGYGLLFLNLLVPILKFVDSSFYFADPNQKSPFEEIYYSGLFKIIQQKIIIISVTISSKSVKKTQNEEIACRDISLPVCSEASEFSSIFGSSPSIKYHAINRMNEILTITFYRNHCVIPNYYISV